MSSRLVFARNARLTRLTNAEPDLVSPACAPGLAVAAGRARVLGPLNGVSPRPVSRCVSGPQESAQSSGRVIRHVLGQDMTPSALCRRKPCSTKGNLCLRRLRRAPK